ncbi:LLM class flavin-dependent oxidoreductase [Bacillus sp. B15-48]|uniref:LLM class flavin-dependent oxidoreductase n=1 Tax=Bacillus sp. B15-48 TaxID=1548601 RepID=UPI00193F3A51|nr:LLM class flavin-dependent oxidoreductase [Bacillus sp. B15-48]MBM4761804.1 LLM class flavin-dependent oxidoreductase [Bacillus sp. B15-48]
MKFGISFFPDSHPEDKSGEAYYTEALNLTEEADQLGYHHTRIVEHYEDAYGGYSSNPSIFLAAASQRTKNLRLITGCVLPVFTHPVKLAHELSMLDAISGGRVEVGFARAFLPHEFNTFGIPMSESNQRFRESLDVIQRLWTEDKVTHAGEMYKFENVSVLPRPTQKKIPTWVAAIQTAESFKWAGENGHNLMVVPYLADYDKLRDNIQLYKDAYENAGHGKVQKDQIQMALHTYVREDEQQAIEEGEGYMNHYVNVFLESATAWDNTTSDQYKGYNMIADALRSMTYDRVLREHRVAIGNPETVTERMKELSEFFGVHLFSLQMNFGNMKYDHALQSVRLFGKEVIPKLETLTV